MGGEYGRGGSKRRVMFTPSSETSTGSFSILYFMQVHVGLFSLLYGTRRMQGPPGGDNPLQMNIEGVSDSSLCEGSCTVKVSIAFLSTPAK